MRFSKTHKNHWNPLKTIHKEVEFMSNIYNSAPSAYDYPLIIKQLLNRAKTVSLEQEVVYADKKRFTYKELFQRINRLANVLAG